MQIDSNLLLLCFYQIAFLTMVLKSKETPAKKEKKPSIFSLLIPYRKMVILLIVFALLGNGINLLIPKIISSAIDSYSLKEGGFQPGDH